MNENEKTVNFGEGLEIIGLQLRSVFIGQSADAILEHSEKLEGIPRRMKLYGEFTDTVVIDRELPLDFKLDQHIPLSADAEVQTMKAIEEHAEKAELVRLHTANSFYQFKIKDSQGDIYYLNTGSLRGDTPDMILENLWKHLTTYQGWVDEQREEEYAPAVDTDLLR